LATVFDCNYLGAGTFQFVAGIDYGVSRGRNFILCYAAYYQFDFELGKGIFRTSRRILFVRHHFRLVGNADLRTVEFGQFVYAFVSCLGFRHISVCFVDGGNVVLLQSDFVAVFQRRYACVLLQTVPHRICGTCGIGGVAMKKLCLP